ncbi:MAG: glycosyltransferase [Bacteroidota bacterium]
MNNNPLLSICTLTYNHENFIAKTLDGFLSQETNFEFEIVIGEDASTDNTREIIKKYHSQFPDKIIILENEYNLGMVKNWVNALDGCEGKYIAFCEGDDYWTDPYKLQKQVDFLEANPEYGMVSSDVNLIDENGNPLPDTNMVLKQREKRKPTVDFFDLLETNLVNTLTVCVRADLMKSLTEKVVEENLWFVYDYWFWLHIALKSKIRIFDEKIAAYRIHKKGISRQNGVLKKQRVFIIWDAIKSLLKNKPNLSYNEKQIIARKVVGLIRAQNLSFGKKIKIACWSFLHYKIFLPFLSKKNLNIGFKSTK